MERSTIESKLSNCFFKCSSLPGKDSNFDFTNLGYLLKTIVDQEIFYPTLDLLNDPFEGTFYSKHERRKRLFLSQKLRTQIQKYRIYSMSSNMTNILLWSHYADALRGYAIAFDNTKQPFNEATEVCYSSSISNLKKDAHTLLTNKSIDWHYEQEWRLLQKGDSRNNGYVKFDEASIKAIIFGVYMHSFYRVFLDTFLKKFNINTYTADAVDSEYKIQVVSNQDKQLEQIAKNMKYIKSGKLIMHLDIFEEYLHSLPKDEWITESFKVCNELRNNK